MNKQIKLLTIRQAARLIDGFTIDTQTCEKWSITTSKVWKQSFNRGTSYL